MNPLLKLSAIFAVWELGKLIIGRKRILAVKDDKTDNNDLGCLLLVFEVPYAIWGCWLPFSDINAAIALWSLTIISTVLYFVNKPLEAKFYPVNCLLSAVALIAVFVGKL